MKTFYVSSPRATGQVSFEINAKGDYYVAVKTPPVWRHLIGLDYLTFLKRVRADKVEAL